MSLLPCRKRESATVVFMNRRAFLPIALLFLAAGNAAHGESLRCPGGLVSEGDSRLSVRYKCGPPLLQDSYCAPVYQQAPPYQLAPVPPSVFGLPCVVVDEWLYERGDGNMTATVRFQSGAVSSIRYGRTPQ